MMIENSRKYGRYLCTLVIILSLPLLSQAQQTGTLFNHYNIQNGLIMNNVEYIHIDMDGFVWLGTYAGLQRFDGYEFKAYTYDPANPSSISDNFISTIFEDDSANLWIGTSANGFEPYDGEFNRAMWYDEYDENWDRLLEFVGDKTLPLNGQEISVLEIIGYKQQ